MLIGASSAQLRTRTLVLRAGVDVVAVGLGSTAAGAEFARLTQYPSDKLYADPESACCKALGFSPGFMPGSDINGYAKIFPMLAGIGSPGTMQVRPFATRDAWSATPR